ncbi:MAG: HAD family hydrolase [Candidatus Omnitrophica bacterium]|nr:HAD family hydrolase [Candidatus Omnitrophota bacterium]
MRIVFLDRDGVINKYPGDTEYVKSWEEFELLPRVTAALKKLKTHGFEVVIVSNQAGVSKGLYSQEALDAMTQNMLDEFAKAQVTIREVHYCTHRTEDNCNCRKPKIGLVEKTIDALAKEGLEIDIEKSFFIGDTIRDIQTGKAAGLKTLLVFSGKEKPENKQNWESIPDFTALDLFEAAELVISH